MPNIKQTLGFMQKERAWQRKYDANAPRIGDLAPDFELWDIDGQHSVRLSDFRGVKPTALVFGSFT